MNSTGNTSNNAHLHWSHVLLIVLATIVLTVAGTYWVLTTYVFVSSFEPVVLSTKEEKTLEQKLRTIGYDFSFSSPTTKRNDDLKGEIDKEGFLKPQAYSEQ
ncbi:MAG TPA: arginine N-succinyltransferase, partial [Nitrosomonas europaea]|nr:arginine N-succinyltransferase [Nitrosomonas europaea]